MLSVTLATVTGRRADPRMPAAHALPFPLFALEQTRQFPGRAAQTLLPAM
jgi:hypothetical protein